MHLMMLSPKVGTDTKAAEIALESAATKLQLSVEKLTAASVTIGVVADAVPEGIQGKNTSDFKAGN